MQLETNCVVGVDIELDRLSVFLEDQKVGREGLVLIIDREGEVKLSEDQPCENGE